MTPDDARAAAEKVVAQNRRSSRPGRQAYFFARALLDQAETLAAVTAERDEAQDAVEFLAVHLDEARAERDKARHLHSVWLLRADDLARQVAAVDSLHAYRPDASWHDGVCGECEQPWPCGTARTLAPFPLPSAVDPMPCSSATTGVGDVSLACGLPSGHEPPHVDQATGASWELRPVPGVYGPEQGRRP